MISRRFKLIKCNGMISERSMDRLILKRNSKKSKKKKMKKYATRKNRIDYIRRVCKNYNSRRKRGSKKNRKKKREKNFLNKRN